MIPDPLPPKQHNPLRLETEIEAPTVLTPDDEAKPKNEIGLRLGEHIGVVGSTGSGKTYFVLRGLLPYFARMYPHAKRYIIDSTDDPAILKYVNPALPVYGNHPPDLLHSPSHTLVWTPRNTRIPEDYAEFFRRLNDAREETVLIVDEAASITREASEELEALLKQLRKHGGTCVVLTQQIARMDTTLFSQMTHYFQFTIGTERYDLAQSRSYLDVSKEEQRNPVYPYGFFYRKVRGNSPMEEYRDVSDFFRS